MFSKTCEYGIKATLYIAVKSLEKKRVSLKNIVEEINSPEAFTAKILQQLTKSKIITSNRGSQGGFSLDPEDLKTIKLSQIVAVLDGDSIYTGCGLGMEKCNELHPCPMHEKFVNIRSELKTMLESTSIFDLVNDLKEGVTFLKS